MPWSGSWLIGGVDTELSIDSVIALSSSEAGHANLSIVAIDGNVVGTMLVVDNQVQGRQIRLPNHQFVDSIVVVNVLRVAVATVRILDERTQY